MPSWTNILIMSGNMNLNCLCRKQTDKLCSYKRISIVCPKHTDKCSIGLHFLYGSYVSGLELAPLTTNPSPNPCQ